MRVARVLGGGESFYHILSRIVDRRLILNDGEKERFRKLMRSVERFSGCQVLTWCCLDNHFHICLRVPEPEPVPSPPSSPPPPSLPSPPPPSSSPHLSTLANAMDSPAADR